MAEDKDNQGAASIAVDGEPEIAGAEGSTVVEGQGTPAPAVASTRTRRQIRQACRRKWQRACKENNAIVDRTPFLPPPAV